MKATIEHFLTVGGNYNLDVIAEMIMDKTNIGSIRHTDGAWKTSTITSVEYFGKTEEYNRQMGIEIEN